MSNKPTAEDELPASKGSQEAKEHTGGPGGSTAEVCYPPHTDTLRLAGDDTMAHRDGPVAMDTDSQRQERIRQLVSSGSGFVLRQARTKQTNRNGERSAVSSHVSTDYLQWWMMMDPRMMTPMAATNPRIMTPVIAAAPEEVAPMMVVIVALVAMDPTVTTHPCMQRQVRRRDSFDHPWRIMRGDVHIAT